jgi:hypothetical protein
MKEPHLASHIINQENKSAAGPKDGEKDRGFPIVFHDNSKFHQIITRCYFSMLVRIIYT